MALLKDRMRLAGVLKNDLVLFETEALRQRAVGLFPERRDDFRVVPPARFMPGLATGEAKYGYSTTASFDVLLLSGFHPNKNWHMLPDIALSIDRTCPTSRLRFVLSIASDAPGAASLLREFESRGQRRRVAFAGSIPQSKLGQTLPAFRGLVLLSNLESFSNNVLEAWESRLPLIISDRDWARAACADAAEYVEPTDADSVAAALLRLEHDPFRRRDLVLRGESRLRDYPTYVERARSVVSILERAVLA